MSQGKDYKHVVGSLEEYSPIGALYPTIPAESLEIPLPGELVLPGTDGSSIPADTRSMNIYEFQGNRDPFMPYHSSSIALKRKRAEEIEENRKMSLYACNFRFGVPTKFVEDKGGRPWTTKEEVFLIGCVFTVLFQTGSLSPTKAQRERNCTCWDRIKYLFDKATARYAYLTSQQDTGGWFTCKTRTQYAMQRHFKGMKSQAHLRSFDCDDVSQFSQLYTRWMTEFNVNNRLTCSSNKFALLMSQGAY